MMFARPAATALTLALTAGLLSAQDKHTLRYAFVKGTTGHYVASTLADVDMNMGGRPMKQAMNMDMFMKFEVASVAEGTANVIHTLQRVTMKGEIPMQGKLDIDTDNEDSVPARFERLLDMVGEKISTQIDARGNVEVELPSSLKNQAAQMSGIQEDLFTQLLIVFPDQAIAVGESWSTDSAMSMGQMGELKMSVVNKFVSFDDGELTIESNLTIDPDSIANLPVKPNIKSAKNTVVLKLDEPLPVRMSTEMVMDMEMNQGGADMSIKMVSRRELKRVKAPMKKDEAGDK